MLQEAQPVSLREITGCLPIIHLTKVFYILCGPHEVGQVPLIFEKRLKRYMLFPVQRPDNIVVYVSSDQYIASHSLSGETGVVKPLLYQEFLLDGEPTSRSDYSPP